MLKREGIMVNYKRVERGRTECPKKAAKEKKIMVE